MSGGDERDRPVGGRPEPTQPEAPGREPSEQARRERARPEQAASGGREHVAAAIAAYHDALSADPDAAGEQAEQLQASFRRHGVVFGDAPMRTCLRPHLIARAEWEDLRASACALLELLARVARRAFDGDAVRLCGYLGTPEAEVPWVALDPGEPDVAWSRLDAFLGEQGPRFIEVNNDAPAGFGYGDRMAVAFSELRAFREVAGRFTLTYPASAPALVEAVSAAGLARGTGRPRIAIVDFDHVKTRPDQEILRQSFLEHGFECALADPRACELRGARLYASGFETDLVYRRALLSELIAEGDTVKGFFAAYAARAAVFVNSFRCRLSEDKALLALVTDEQFEGLLAAEERALVERLVPWTRKLEERHTRHAGRAIDLVPFVMRERERLVLKPAHDYGGRQVWIGSETALGDWEQAVLRGVNGPWVVQERQPIPEELFPSLAGGSLQFVPLKLNVNPFYVKGAEVGAVARASRESVINVSAGGGSVPTFVVG